MKYWSEESKNPAVLNKILEGLKIPTNCIGVRVPISTEAVKKMRKSYHLIKVLRRNYQILEKGQFLLHQQSLKC